jgi:uncharacterized Tic20 family protein
MSSQLRDTPKKRKRRSRALLPVMGLMLAVLLGVVAVFTSPLLVELIEEQQPDVANQFADFEADYGENAVDYVIAAVMWLVMLAFMMFIAAMAIGSDKAEKEMWETLGPHPADKKAVIKAKKKQLKEAKKRARQKQRAKKK